MADEGGETGVSSFPGGRRDNERRQGCLSIRMNQREGGGRRPRNMCPVARSRTNEEKITRHAARIPENNESREGRRGKFGSFVLIYSASLPLGACFEFKVEKLF